MTASKRRKGPSALVRPALWFCACNLLAAALAAQCTNPTQVPNGAYTSGDYSQVDNNALSASSFAVSGGATATFAAGNCIQLNPGFHASAISATVPTTFHAWVDIAPTAVSVSPSSPPQNPPLTQSFTWTVSSPAGQSNLAHVFALFNTTSASTANACYIHYDAASGLVYLADNAGTTWLGGFAPSSSGTTGNSQCTIAGTNSSPNPTSSGTQLGLTLTVTFQTSFAGTKNEYLYALDGSGLPTGWQQMGTWTVPAPPVPDFTLTAAVDTYYVQTGISSTPTYTIIVTPQNGFNSPVSFSSTPFYGCGSGSFNPAQVSGPPWTATLTTSCYETLANSYFTTVLASGGGKSHQLYLYLTATQSQQYLLTTSVSPAGSGAISPSSGWYNNGTQVTVTAAANAGYQFTGFSGSLTGRSPGSVIMNSNKSVTANFTQTVTSYSLTTSVSPSGSGTLAFSPACCTYNAGTQVTITAAPAGGYQFSGFTGVDSSSGSTGYVTMNANRNVTAAMAQTPDLGQMAVWSSFVDRHELLVGPNGPTGPGANGGLYGLSGTDLSAVNALADSASQQLIQLQAQNLTGSAYVNQRSMILQNLNTQLHGQLSPASASIIDAYANAFLQPRTVSVPQACRDSKVDCTLMHSEINFFNGGGSNFGLGAYAKSWVEGQNANLFTATVSSVKESYSPLFNPPSDDSSWQVIFPAHTDNKPGGQGAMEPHTESNPRRGTYKMEAFHQFSNMIKAAVLSRTCRRSAICFPGHPLLPRLRKRWMCPVGIMSTRQQWISDYRWRACK